MQKRNRTGIPGLDKIFLGGLIPNRTYLILGTTGSGKTILSIQWLREGVRLGEKCLYFTLAERKVDIEGNIESFGWSLKGIEVIDLVRSEESQKSTIEEYHVFTPDEVEQTGVWEAIYQAIAENKPQRVVIDSASVLRYLSTDTYQFRKHILGLAKYLNRRNATSMFLFGREMEDADSVALAADGVLCLRMENSPGCVVGLRYMEIEKMRGSGFLTGYHPFRIADKGLRVYPHEIEKTGKNKIGKHLTLSGVKELDEMLGGGIESGTTTIISGATGTGKSTLASQFLINAANQGIPGLVIMFEESPDAMTHRCRGIGVPVDDLIEKKMLKLVRINPMEIYPDELLVKIRHYINRDGYKLVMIDSLRGYTFAIEEFGMGTLRPHLHNLITFLNRKQITTFLVNEVEVSAGSLKITEHGLSHFGDNIIILRFVERAGKVLKIIGCLKKRLGAFQAESREFHITSNGISLSARLKNLEGILTGMRYVNQNTQLDSTHESD